MFKFTINSKKFECVNELIKLTHNATMMQCAYLLMEADADAHAVTLTAANTDARMSVELCPAEIEGKGATLVVPKTLKDLAAKIGDMPMTLTYEDGATIAVETSVGRYSIATNDPQNFPAAHATDGEHYALKAADIASGIKATAFAASTDDYRLQLQGVQMKIADGKLAFAATDTRILARWAKDVAQPGTTAAVVIPARHAQLIASAFEDREELADVEITPKSATFTCGEIVFTTSLAEGVYPDITRVFPPTTIKAEISAASLRAALSRIGVCANAVTPSIRVQVAADGTMSMSTLDKDTQQTADEAVYGTADGVLDALYSYKYLQRVLSAFSGAVVLRARDGKTPAVFAPAEQQEGVQYCALVMPMVQH